MMLLDLHTSLDSRLLQRHQPDYFLLPDRKIILTKIIMFELINYSPDVESMLLS